MSPHAPDPRAPVPEGIPTDAAPLAQRARSDPASARPVLETPGVISVPSDPPDPLVGALLHGKYRLVRLIGTGGFGTVYEASDERGAGNRVAVKVLRKEFSGDARLIRAFRAEARRMTRLSHPNIVDWKNFDAAEDGTCYFVMELVEGEELDRILKREGPLHPDRVARIALQILDAMSAAHHLAEGGSVLHLDLKPRNVFILPARVGRPEQVKVIDFGIGQHVGGEVEEAAVIPGEGHVSGTTDHSDFKPSTLRFQDAALHDAPGLRRCHACTPEYASPEQAAHVLGLPDVVALDGRSDLYSLGVMTFQMLTGELPFSRPMLRTDYLRLHRSGKPRRIASTGTKAPRALVRFVERCLEKDPEDRFRDAREAHTAVERIVRPPLAMRILAATVILAGAAFAFGGILSRGSASAEVLAAAGADLGPQNPLYLGPERRSAILTLRAPGLADEGSPLTLVRASNDEEVAGSRVTWNGPAELRLELVQDPGQGREGLSVRIEAEGLRFAPFDLVWLGPLAWSLASARFGTVELGRKQQTIDPLGLVLEVALAGAGRDDVARIFAHAETGDEVELVASGVQGEQRLFRADLGLLRLDAGPARITIRAADLAGGAHQIEIPLLIVAGALGADAELCEPRADGGCARFNQMSGRFLLNPSSRTLLRVAPSRSASLDWRVRLEGASGEPAWNHVQAASLHEIPIELGPISGVEVRTGSVELRADESDLVVRTNPAQRGVVSLSIPFLVSAERADFGALLELPDGLRVPLAEDRTTWVGTGNLVLVAERLGRPAMSLRLDDGRSGILKAGQQEMRFPLDIQGDATHALGILCYRFDTAEQSLADQPDTHRSFRIGVDTIPPVLSAPSGVDGADFRELGAMPEAMTPDLSPGDVGAPVRVSWQLERENDGLVRRGTWIAEQDPIPLRSLWTGGQGLPDGAWRLELVAVDEAGNAAQPVRARFRAAFVGPEVGFEAPRPGTWQGQKEGWLVQVRASDPNGVDGVACAIVAEDGARLPVDLAPGAGPAEDRELRGHVAIPHEWSSRKVRLEVEARDGLGQKSRFRLDGLVLPDIAPPRPLAVRATGAHGGHGARMRLVPGNAGAQYLFGGRGDDVENSAHRDADLLAFAQAGAVRSWSVPYAAGEIGDFYLDDREVTRADFQAFVRDPDGHANAEHGPPGSEAPSPARHTELLAQLEGDPDLPVTGITWDEAFAFAHWIGRRLPSWIELEYATRGGSSAYRPFASFESRPPAAGEVNAKGLGPGRAWDCGSGADITPDTGIRDLAGNVAEWTSSPLCLNGEEERDDRGAYFRQRRTEMLAGDARTGCVAFWIAGGSFREENYYFEAAAARPRQWQAGHLGFRCALSIEDVRAGLDRRALEDVR